MNKTKRLNTRLEIVHANNPGSFIGLSKNKIKLTGIDSSSKTYDQEKVSNIIVSGNAISSSYLRKTAISNPIKLVEIIYEFRKTSEQKKAAFV